MPDGLPTLFVERLSRIIPEDQYAGVFNSFSHPIDPVIRVNTLCWNVVDAESFLREQGVLKAPLPSIPGAYQLLATAKDILRGAAPVEDGRLYWQEASSLLPALVLGLRANDRVLDLCAAPGSKTTQMAALMQGEGTITAIESVRGRFFKLRAVLALMKATNVTAVCMDGRRFQPRNGLFEKVLVDAPCSSEGRFNTHDPETFAYWSPRKVKEMMQKQRGLLLNAGRSVAPQGALVYSTCTFSPEENEAVVAWFLKKSEGAFVLESFDLPGVPRYPAVTTFHDKPFKHDLSACWRVLPDEVFSGFFIAKFAGFYRKDHHKVAI